MKRILFLALSLCFAALLSNASLAQAPMSAEKRKLIAEMITATEMEKQFPEIVDGLLKEMENSYPLGFNAAIDGNDSLTSEQKAELKATSGERFVAFSNRFRKALSEKVDFNKYIQEAVYPLYDKFYTEQELRDINAFYKTTTGQKLVKTMPALFAESNRLATEKFVPQILPIIQSLIKEEFDQVGTPPKPKAN